jgi:CRISPR-associated Csx2 family protein
MKKFISILGTGNYTTTRYYWKEKSNYVETNFIQEATLKLLCSDFTKNDEVLIFVTQKSYQSNWIEKPVDKNYPGLEVMLKIYPFEVKCIQIPDGNNEEEIWDIFQKIYDSIEENDELYVDITHSFRSLPMLLLVLLNYLKVLKNVRIQSLTYGNWEGRDENNYSPIVDLLPLVELQDWTIAANNFIKYGNSKMLVELTQKEIQPILKETQGKNQAASELRSLSTQLKEFTEILTTVRGKELYKRDIPTNIKNTLSTVKNNHTIIAQLNPILKKIEEKISDFSTDPIKRFYNAAKWCYDHEMYQQAYSFLFEGFISQICLENNLNVESHQDRSLVTSAIRIIHDNIPEDKWNTECQNNKSVVKKLIESLNIKDSDMLRYISSIQDLRNDFMHAGLRENSSNSKKLIETFDKFFNNYASQLLQSPLIPMA